MSISFSKPRRPSAIPEHSLWRLEKTVHVLKRQQTRFAEARTRMTPLGPEIRIYVDGELLWSQVLRDGRDVGASSEEKRGDFLALGWSEVG
jgi:hypothetical protein